MSRSKNLVGEEKTWRKRNTNLWPTWYLALFIFLEKLRATCVPVPVSKISLSTLKSHIIQHFTPWPETEQSNRLSQRDEQRPSSHYLLITAYMGTKEWKKNTHNEHAGVCGAQRHLSVTFFSPVPTSDLVKTSCPQKKWSRKTRPNAFDIHEWSQLKRLPQLKMLLVRQRGHWRSALKKKKKYGTLGSNLRLHRDDRSFDSLWESNCPSRVRVFKGTSAQTLLDQIQSFLLDVLSLQNQIVGKLHNSFWCVRYGRYLITTMGLIRKKIENESQAVS